MTPTTLDRFWAKVDRRSPDDCWPWTAGCTKAGYGVFYLDRRHPVYAHRFAYEATKGPVPNGLQIDHVRARGCVLRHCVNPAHLEAVTQLENIRRGSGASVVNAAKTECVHGHSFDAANTYVTPDGARQCRRCKAHRNRREVRS